MQILSKGIYDGVGFTEPFKSLSLEGKIKMKKILLIMICMFLLIGMVSAAKIKYENEDMKVNFKKSFLGIGGSDLGSIELKSHKSVTEIRKLGAGENQTVMFYDFRNWKKHKDGLGEVIFIDMNTGEEIEKDYYFAELTTEQQPKYKTICEDKFLSNETKYQECSEIQNGFKQVEVWKGLDTNDIPNKNIRIGLITDVEVGDYIDAVWTITGKQVKKHASWTASLNVGITHYYKLDGSSDPVLDELFTSNGTNSGATPSVTGKINTAYDFESSESDFITLGDEVTTNQISVSAWLKLESNVVSGQGYFWFTKDDNAVRSWAFVISEVTEENRLALQWGTSITKSSNTNLTTGVFHHIVVTMDDSTNELKFYVNGVSIQNTTNSGSPAGGSSTLFIGKREFSGAEGYYDGVVDELGVWNRTLTQAEVVQLYNNGDGISYTTIFTPTITLNSPIDFFNTTNPTINFNATVTEETFGIDNVTLFINNIGNETNTSTIEGEYVFTKTFSDTTSTWIIEACNSIGCVNSSSRTFTIDKSIPTIEIESPTGALDLLEQNTNISLNFTAIDLVILDTCLLEYNNTNTTIPCINGTKVVTGFDYQPGFNNLTIYANDSLNNVGSSFTSWVVKVLENSRTFNATSFETASETFITDVTANSSLTAVTLDYNGTDYSMTQSGTNWTRTLDIPEEVLNRTFRFKYTYAGDSIYSDYFYQNISVTNFSICDGSLTTPFFNVSFQDENSLTAINASIPTSSFLYYLGSGSVNKTYAFVSATEFANFTFCATPTTLNLNVDSRIQYKGTSYPQRTYNPLVLTYENTTTNKILYLLGVADGIYVTFQTINLAQEPIIGATVNATRTISDETVVVGDGSTDASGSVTFWLNPDFQHAITFGKEGFLTTVFLVIPTQTSYTITIGAISTEEPDYTRGITKLTNPNQDFLDNATEYDFNFTLASVYWTVTEFGFTLTYENGTIIKTTSSSSNGGTLSANDINVTFILTNESHIDMDYYYIINETYINGSRTWEIISTEGRQFSLWRFFTDLSLYINSGNLFGFDDFGRILISIIVLIMVAGGVSLKYGIRSDTFTMGVIFGIVVLLDYGLNFFPAIKIGSNLAINNFATFIVAIILIAVIIKEERN